MQQVTTIVPLLYASTNEGVNAPAPLPHIPKSFLIFWSSCIVIFRAPGYLRGCLASCEGLREVADDIVGVLDSDRQAHQVVANSNRQALLGRELVVRHQRGLLDERLDAAQGGR